jgi:hypothetical protein
VNQLGVGLHAYGFTDGTWPKIHIYWLSQAILLVYGLWLSFTARRPKTPVSVPADAAVAES